VWQRVPYYVEAEALILAAILFTAVGLSSLPPAIDIDEQQATWAEVVDVFSPKMPRLSSPSFEEAISAYYEKPTLPAPITAGVESYWSDYNHNVSGLFLVAMGVVALLSFFEIGRWTYYWPLGFIGIGIFQWLRSDVESSPLGPLGFWERFLAESETLDHQLSIVLVLALGVLELRARTTGKPHARLPYVFPVLCAIGGVLLLGHSHSAFELKQEYLFQVTHTAMGSLAVIMACGRWLELRLRPSVGRGAGLVSILAMLGIGLILLFYRETPVA
jgi:putative copper resistance protein D